MTVLTGVLNDGAISHGHVRLQICVFVDVVIIVFDRTRLT